MVVGMFHHCELSQQQSQQYVIPYRFLVGIDQISHAGISCKHLIQKYSNSYADSYTHLVV